MEIFEQSIIQTDSMLSEKFRIEKVSKIPLDKL